MSRQVRFAELYSLSLAHRILSRKREAMFELPERRDQRYQSPGRRLRQGKTDRATRRCQVPPDPRRGGPSVHAVVGVAQLADELGHRPPFHRDRCDPGGRLLARSENADRLGYVNLNSGRTRQRGFSRSSLARRANEETRHENAYSPGRHHSSPAEAGEVYRGRFFDRDFAFHGLKRLLGAADCSKAGDRHAGLAAASETEREAARTILSGLTLQHLYDHPLTDDRRPGRFRDARQLRHRSRRVRRDRRLDAGRVEGSPAAFVRRRDPAHRPRPDRRHGGGAGQAVRRPRADLHRPQDHQAHARPARCSARRARCRRACSRTIRPTICAASRCSLTGACRWAPAMR